MLRLGRPPGLLALGGGGRLGRLGGTPPLLRVLLFLRSTSRPFRLAPRRRRGTSCVHVGGVACVRRLRAGGLFSLSFFLFGDGLRPRVARCHRVPMRLRLFSWSGYRPCVRRAAAGSGGRRGAAERRPCYDSSSLAAIRAFRYVLLYSGRPQPPHGFPPSCATRAPLGSCPN